MEKTIFRTGYTIIVDNSMAQAFNINIDYPTFFCWAYSEAEAIGLMSLSNFAHKSRKIVSIDKF